MNLVLYSKRFFEQSTVFLKRLNETRSKIYAILLAGVFFALMAFYTFQHASTPFVHDSLYYWQLADTFSLHDFSITNFSDSLRGYLFPFLLFTLKVQANLFHFDAKLLFYVYSALFFALLSVYIVPWAFRNIFGWKITLFGNLLIAFIIFYFWRGHFLYPLSDFPAFTSLLVGISLVAKSLRSKNVFYVPIGIGIFIGAALNIRPVYLVSLIVICPFLLIHVFKLGVFKGGKWIFLVLLGFGIVLFPQLRINQTHFNVNSPLVLSRVVGEENLYEKQLFWGLGTQKYEINSDENYHSIILVYEDPFIQKLQKTNLLKEKTFARYLNIMRKFPLDWALSFFRHTFNGLDIFYSTPIVRNVFADHTFFSIINYTIWFLLAIYFFRMDLTKLDQIKLLGVGSLLAPIVLAIPTAVEVRFFLPAYLMAYGVIAFDYEFIQILKSLFRPPWNLLRLLIFYALWLLVCFTISSATIESLV